MAEFIITDNGERFRVTGAATEAEALREYRARKAASALAERGLGDPPFGDANDPNEERVFPRTQPTLGEFAGRGISQALGAPVDIANAALGVVGLDSARPIGGSEQIANLMRNVAPVAGPFEQPETLLESGAEGLGLAAGALLPGAG